MGAVTYTWKIITKIVNVVHQHKKLLSFLFVVSSVFIGMSCVDAKQGDSFIYMENYGVDFDDVLLLPELVNTLGIT